MRVVIASPLACDGYLVRVVKERRKIGVPEDHALGWPGNRRHVHSRLRICRRLNGGIRGSVRFGTAMCDALVPSGRLQLPTEAMRLNRPSAA